MTQLEKATDALRYWTGCALRDSAAGVGAGQARTAATEWATIVLALTAVERATPTTKPKSAE